MAAEMRKMWGVAASSAAQARSTQPDPDAVKSLMEICGPDLSEGGARKLLVQWGDASSALNFFMDLPPEQRARLNATEDTAKQAPEVGPINATLPRGWHSFRDEIVTWVKAQCAGLGVSVNVSHQTDTTPMPRVLPNPAPDTNYEFLKVLFESASGSHNRGLQALEESTEREDETDGKLWLPRCFGPEEELGKSRTVDVQLCRRFMDALLQREKKYDEKSTTYSAVASKLISLKNMSGTIDWRSPWVRGTGPNTNPANNSARGAVTVSVKGSSEAYIIPACMLSFPTKARDSNMRFTATQHSTRDPIAPLAVEIACSKVMIFDRVGNTVSDRWLSAVTDTLQNRFLDTQVFCQRRGDGYRFAVCGLGAHWVRHWLSGRILHQIPEGHAGLRGDAIDEMETKTGCAILLTPHPSALREKLTKIAVWEWESSPSWTAYSAEATAQMEEAHAAGQASVEVTLKYVPFENFKHKPPPKQL